MTVKNIIDKLVINTKVQLLDAGYNTLCKEEVRSDVLKSFYQYNVKALFPTKNGELSIVLGEDIVDRDEYCGQNDGWMNESMNG